MSSYRITDGYLSRDENDALLAHVTRYRQAHHLPEITRPGRGRPLRYSVIDGEAVGEHFPELLQLRDRVNVLAAEFAGRPVTPLDDVRVAVNVNLTPPGGAYRWHYDRNAVTAILYLNSVEAGETDLYPNYRLRLGSRYSGLQRLADRLLEFSLVRLVFGRRVTVAPAAGRLVMMAGNVCLHSVRPVTGGVERVAVILSYDEPGASFAIESGLNTYLYTDRPVTEQDPNYIVKD